MQNSENSVIHLPTELYRLRETDRLVRDWAAIQDLRGEERIVAMFRWRHEMLQHIDAFHAERTPT